MHASPSTPFSRASLATDLTVSVVSHGHAMMIPTLLNDLARADCRISRVVITLNSKTESDAELRLFAASMPWPVVFITNDEPMGFGANHNQAFQKVPTPVSGVLAAFAVINPDIRLTVSAGGHPVDPFSPLLEALLIDQTGLAAPTVLGSTGQPEDAWRQTLTPWRLFKRYATPGPRHPESADRAQWAAGMLLICRADAYREIGGFDEGFFMYCEDMDLCLRLSDAGWLLAFVGLAQVVHDAQRASRSKHDHRVWHVKSLLRFWRKRVIQALRG